VELETDPDSPFFAIAKVTLGHAFYVAGDLDAALVHLGAASRSASAPKIIRALSLSTESLVEAERGELTRSRECAEQAMQVIEAEGLRATPQASLAYTAFGQAQAAAGKTEEALSVLDRGLALRRETTAHGPWGMIHHLLVTARVAAESGRLPLARELLVELAPRMSAYAEGMDAMYARLAAVQRLVRTETAVEGEPLTSREHDILRLLQGPMSLQQIAGELYLSFNTVKTHTRAVYRKLGVHTRAEAVRSGRRQHLI
jgi:LuxR family maltose regulon positive regulatory protein